MSEARPYYLLTTYYSTNKMTLDMYRQHILDHAKHPRHWGALPQADAQAEVANPLCGDKLSITLRLQGGTVRDIGFQGEGCAISKAAASMLAEHAVGKPVATLEALTVDDMVKLLGVPVNPARLRCASLGLEALQQALRVGVSS